MGIKKRLKDWYKGKYIPPPKNDPNSPIIIISIGHYEKPFLARVLEILFKFWLEHWKWNIGTAIALIALFLKVIND